jgi:hypothetical protein
VGDFDGSSKLLLPMKSAVLSQFDPDLPSVLPPVPLSEMFL